MVVEILVNAIDRNHSDPVINARGCWKKGYPVVAKEQGWGWGASECMPVFAMVRVDDAPDLASIEAVVTPWRRRTAYTILAHDAAQDFFRVRIYSDPATIGSNPQGQVVVSEMEEFLKSWGAESISDDQGVVFTVTAMAALNAIGYLNFGSEEEYVVFTETAYDADAGTHTVSCNYSTSNLKPEAMAKTLTDAGCDILSHDDVNAVVVFNAHRNVMIGYLEQSVARQFDTEIGRAQYYFPAVIADAAVTEMSMAQLQSAMIDIRTV